MCVKYIQYTVVRDTGRSVWARAYRVGKGLQNERAEN